MGISLSQCSHQASDSLSNSSRGNLDHVKKLVECVERGGNCPPVNAELAQRISEFMMHVCASGKTGLQSCGDVLRMDAIVKPRVLPLQLGRTSLHGAMRTLSSRFGGSLQ